MGYSPDAEFLTEFHDEEQHVVSQNSVQDVFSEKDGQAIASRVSN